MINPSQSRIGAFLNSDKKIIRGVEKENLRSNAKGEISNKGFPESLGSHHFNKFVTLDYSEPHLELVTPTFDNNHELFEFLQQLHSYVEKRLDGDILWNYSMPPVFNKELITLPDAGITNKSKLAFLYRLGLRNRYGDKMQSTAGIHFNISFSETFIKNIGIGKNEFYLGIARNFMRLFPLALRLTGSSPVTHCSFLKGRDLHVEKLGDQNCYLPKSTSLRVSRLGYYSEEQDKNFITFNSLNEYLEILSRYMNTPNEKFSHISSTSEKYEQVNNGTIQMESELYNHIRPKAKQTNLRQYLQLQESGIDYLEVRSIDLNPFSEIGITQNDLLFWETFIFYCAVCDSPPISSTEIESIKENIRRASEVGQECNLINSFDGENAEIDIKELTSNFLNSLRASLKDVSNEDSYDQMFEEFENRNNLPISTQIIESTLKNGNIISFIKEHSQHVSLKNNQELYKLFEEEKASSINNFQAHLSSDELEFDEFIKKFREETK